MTTFSHPKLLQALQTACPELMELTFGCELKDKEGLHDNLWNFLGKYENSATLLFYRKSSGAGLGPESDFEILGHEPQLADVLRSVTDAESRLPIEIEYSACANLFSITYYDSVARAGKRHECFWNLSLGLYGQKPVALDFLEQLLVSK